MEEKSGGKGKKTGRLLSASVQKLGFHRKSFNLGEKEKNFVVLLMRSNVTIYFQRCKQWPNRSEEGQRS